MDKELYSIRMRASLNDKHISGAERIVSSDNIDGVMRELTARATHKTALPDRIVVHVEPLGGQPLRELAALDVVTVNALDVETGRSAAVRVLRRVGVSEHSALAATGYLSGGASPSGGNLRGAIIMDAQSGARLEPDQERGVRASRFDWTEKAFTQICRSLAAASLTHHRTREALALATKVAHAPGVVAELCWSDDADYTAGYVASLQTGYVRFPRLKQAGDAKGGRVFFVNGNDLNLDAFVGYLRIEPVLIVKAGECRLPVTLEDYFRSLK